jgi:hypothetical protein
MLNRKVISSPISTIERDAAHLGQNLSVNVTRWIVSAHCARWDWVWVQMQIQIACVSQIEGQPGVSSTQREPKKCMCRMKKPGSSP